MWGNAMLFSDDLSPRARHAAINEIPRSSGGELSCWHLQSRERWLRAEIGTRDEPCVQ